MIFFTLLAGKKKKKKGKKRGGRTEMSFNSTKHFLHTHKD